MCRIFCCAKKRVHKDIPRTILARVIERTELEESTIRFLWKRFNYLVTNDNLMLTEEDIRQNVFNTMGPFIATKFLRNDKSCNFVRFAEVLEPLVTSNSTDRAKELKLRWLFDFYCIEKPGVLSTSDIKELLIIIMGGFNNSVIIEQIVEQIMLDITGNKNSKQVDFKQFSAYFDDLNLDHLKIRLS